MEIYGHYNGNCTVPIWELMAVLVTIDGNLIKMADQGWSPCCSLLMASSLSCSRPVTYLVTEGRMMIRTIVMMALMTIKMMLYIIIMVEMWTIPRGSCMVGLTRPRRRLV